jgi:hypothetical protein
LHIPAKRFNPGSRQSGDGSDPDFSQFPNDFLTLTGREPMHVEKADRLCNACKTTGEKLVLWTLLDTGLRVSELRGLTP